MLGKMLKKNEWTRLLILHCENLVHSLGDVFQPIAVAAWGFGSGPTGMTKFLQFGHDVGPWQTAGLLRARKSHPHRICLGPTVRSSHQRYCCRELPSSTLRVLPIDLLQSSVNFSVPLDQIQLWCVVKFTG